MTTAKPQYREMTITEVRKDFVYQSHCLTLTVSAAAITALDSTIIDTIKDHEGESSASKETEKRRPDIRNATN